MVKENRYLFLSDDLFFRLGLAQYDAGDGRKISETMQYMKRKGWVKYRSEYKQWQNQLFDVERRDRENKIRSCK